MLCSSFFRHPPKAFTPAELEPFLSQQLAAVNQGWLGGIALDAAAAYQRLTDEPNLCRPPGEPTDVLLQFCTILACIRDGTLDRGTAFDVMDRTLSPSRAVGRTLVATFSDLVKEAHAQATWHLPKETLDRILRSHIARLVVELPKSSAAGAGPLSLVLAPVLLSGATLLAVLEGRSPGSITVSELVAQYLRDRWHRPASLGATAPGADAGVHVTDEGDDRYFASAGFGGVDLVLGPVGARVEGPSASIEALSGPNVLGAYANPKLARVEVDLGISKIEADLNLRTGVHAGQEGVGVSVLGLGFEVGATSGLKLATPLGSISLFGL
ncbi:hypothetical protein DFJ73DRAFT_810742 [Zopfochytrium polystomum]|nr:hypothetical protein DFJ73DRAFT_810742 [Zopfochytrium polystomum]